MYRISRRQSTPFNWSATSAPWFQYLGQKVLNPAKSKDAFSLAALTSRCMASDPRDRIFAINQLLVDASLRNSLYADYTISFQHFAIGFFSHVLQVSRRYSFLDQAGLSADSPRNPTPSWPTWVPECRSHNAWERTFVNSIKPNIDSNSHLRLPITNLEVYLDESSVITLKEIIPATSYNDNNEGSIL